MSKDLEEVRSQPSPYLRKNILGKGNKCQGPGAGAHLRHLGNSMGTNVDEMEVVMGDKVRGNGGQII